MNNTYICFTLKSSHSTYSQNLRRLRLFLFRTSETSRSFFFSRGPLAPFIFRRPLAPFPFFLFFSRSPLASIVFFYLLLPSLLLNRTRCQNLFELMSIFNMTHDYLLPPQTTTAKLLHLVSTHVAYDN